MAVALRLHSVMPSAFQVEKWGGSGSDDVLGTSEAIACTGAFEIDYFWYLGYLGKILYRQALDACAGYFPLFCRPRFSGLCGGWLNWRHFCFFQFFCSFLRPRCWTPLRETP